MEEAEVKITIEDIMLYFHCNKAIALCILNSAKASGELKTIQAICNIDMKNDNG